mgnify:CR=1 FL=1
MRCLAWDAASTLFRAILSSLRAVDGYCDDGVLERMTAFWLALGDISSVQTAQQFCDRFVTFGEVNVERIADNILTGVFLGKTLLLIEGFDEAVLIDAKGFPMRSVEEPETEKVIQGAKDGFTETLLTNCNLIRRRLRHPGLTFSLQKIGTISQTDIAIAYLEEHCDKKILNQIKRKLQSLSYK